MCAASSECREHRAASVRLPRYCDKDGCTPRGSGSRNTVTTSSSARMLLHQRNEEVALICRPPKSSSVQICPMLLSPTFTLTHILHHSSPHAQTQRYPHVRYAAPQQGRQAQRWLEAHRHPQVRLQQSQHGLGRNIPYAQRHSQTAVTQSKEQGPSRASYLHQAARTVYLFRYWKF